MSNKPALRVAAHRHQLIKRYYLRNGRPDADWDIVNNNPALFNRVWREMAGWPPGDTPPIIKKQRQP